MRVETKNDRLGKLGREFLFSLNSIFDGYFILSQNGKIFDWKVKDDELKLIFIQNNLPNKNLFKILSHFIEKTDFSKIKKSILENEPLNIEITLEINEEVRYYEIYILILEDNQTLVLFRNIMKQKQIEFELKNERITLKNIIELNPYAIEIKDAEGRHVSANKAFIKMYQTTAPKNYSIFEDPYLEKTGLLDEIKKVKEGKSVSLPEHWYNPHDINPNYPDTLVCQKVVIFPIHDNSGKIEKLIFMHEDITERKTAEKELERERKTLRAIIDLNPYAIDIKDKNGYQVMYNQAFVGFWGAPCPKEFSVFTDPFMKKSGFADYFVRALRGEIVKVPETWYNPHEMLDSSLPDKLSCHKAITFPIFDDNGEVDKMVTMHEDITDKKIIEKELEKERQTLKNIIELNPYAIEIFDNEGNHIGNNKAYVDLYKSVPPLGYNLFKDPIHKKTGVDLLFKRVLNGEVIYNPENWYNPHDLSPELPESLVCHNVSLFPIFDSNGKVEKIVAMFQDITEKKLAEKELEELRKELEIRVKKRTIKLESSEKKYRKAYNRANCFKGLFTHDIANMYQTIGNSIELCKSLLKEGTKLNKIREYFKLIEQQINRGKKLIKNIKNLSDMEESEMPLEPIEIFKNLKNAIQFVQVNFQKQKIKIEIETEMDQAYVFANELLLDVFENILINSVRYNKNENVEIIIKASKLIENEKRYIKIEFKDNGIGIEDFRKELVFQEDYKKRFEVKGMGLGLSLVAKLLELCDGKIWVEDIINGNYTQGSNFILLIPEVK